MRRGALLLAVLLAGCATVAEEYESKVYLPEEVAAALGSDDPTARADAASQVEAMEPGPRREALLSLLGDGRAPVRLLAVGLLGKHHAGDDAVVARLAEVLSLDPDGDVRLAAVDALASSGRVACLPPLITALGDDPALSVKRAAAGALTRITGQDFGRDLAAALDEVEAAADDAMFAYDGWFEIRREALVWDEASSRFFPRE